jgi:hypothetical protein
MPFLVKTNIIIEVAIAIKKGIEINVKGSTMGNYQKKILLTCANRVKCKTLFKKSEPKIELNNGDSWRTWYKKFTEAYNKASREDAKINYE